MRRMSTHFRRPGVGTHDAQVETSIRHSAGEQGIDLAIPANAFLLANRTPQGWLLTGCSNIKAAFDKAGSLVRQGNTGVYVLNSLNGGVVGFNRDGQPDW
jgi:hypothetical protein